MRKTHLILLFFTTTLLSCGESKKSNESPSSTPDIEQTEHNDTLISDEQPPVPSKDEEAIEETSNMEESVTEEPVVEELVPAPSNDGKTIYVYSVASDGFANIREFPTVNSKILGSLKNNGPGAKLLERANGWYKVDFKGTTGYVSSSIVAIGDEEGILGSSKKSVNNSSTSKQKVYYVVLGSWSTLEKAKSYYYHIPDALDLGRIYKTMVNGKTVYRMAVECYRTKSQAQQKIRSIKETFDREAWIWESEGLGQCVYCPKGYDGEPTQPLQPR